MAHTRVLIAFVLLVAGRCCFAIGPNVYKPKSPLHVNAFVGSNESWFSYPEASSGSSYTLPTVTSRPRFGIAVSGGGLRAATLGLGWLRGLHQLGVTDGARYMASNSGGSWLNTAFSFQDKYPNAVFLGAYITPSQLTLDSLAEPAPPESFEAAITNTELLGPGVQAALEDALRSLRRGEQLGVGAWSQNIGTAFLEPYDLNSDKSTFTATGTAGPVHQALQDLDPEEVKVYRYSPQNPIDTAVSSADGTSTASGTNVSGTANNTRAYRPFPIILGAIMLLDTPSIFHPVEFTPLYVGVPPFFDSNPSIGGGFVDPVAFNSPAPQPTPQLPPTLLKAFAANQSADTLLAAPNASAATNSSLNSSQQLIQTELLSLSVKPDYLMPPKVVAGISSSFLANVARAEQEREQALTGTEVLKYWSPISFIDQNLPFGDGGGVDNLAVTPLLRRRMTKIVVLVAALKGTMDVANASDWAGHQWDISGLFGAAPASHPAYGKNNTVTGVPVELMNKNTQVFPQSGYQELFDGLNRTTAAGEPTHHLANYTVLTNSHQAVWGGWQVEVLWVVNQLQTNWEAALPTDTAQLLAEGRQGKNRTVGRVRDSAQGARQERRGKSAKDVDNLGLTNFPYISTANPNYSPELTKLLSQQANWQVVQLAPQLQQLLQGTGVTVTPTA